MTPRGDASPAGPSAPHVSADLAVQLSDLARALEHEEDAADTLVHIVRGAIDLVPGAEQGSISLVTGRRRVRPEVPSGDLPVAVDRIQEEVGQGPCLDAAFKERVVHSADLSTEARWPEFARRASAAGAGSMLCFQLFVHADTLGALNLYSSSAYAFDEESEHVGLLFAAHAAVAYAGIRTQEQLLAGLATRDVIGQAKGIVMERYGISGDRAFALLVRVSRTANRKLRDVCEELVVTRELAAPARPAATTEPTTPTEPSEPTEPAVVGHRPEQTRASQPAS